MRHPWWNKLISSMLTSCTLGFFAMAVFSGFEPTLSTLNGWDTTNYICFDHWNIRWTSMTQSMSDIGNWINKCEWQMVHLIQNQCWKSWMYSSFMGGRWDSRGASSYRRILKIFEMQGQTGWHLSCETLFNNGQAGNTSHGTTWQKEHFINGDKCWIEARINWGLMSLSL